LDRLEDAYWRELNRFQYSLQRHVEERDALLAKVSRGESSCFPLCKLAYRTSSRCIQYSADISFFLTHPLDLYIFFENSIQVDRARHQLDALRRTSVLGDVFRIWHEGPFGTISGFRLGRTAQVLVPWEEVNSAWGQCVLLLQVRG
jgi:hypothetical protein